MQRTMPRVEYFDIQKQDLTIHQPELDAIAQKTKVRESDSIALTVAPIGVIPMVEWKMDVITKVAASSTHANTTVKWMKQIENASTWQELVDPEPLSSLGIKLAAAVLEILPTDLRRQVQVERHALMQTTGKIMNGRQMLWMLYRDVRLNDADNMYEFLDFISFVFLHVGCILPLGVQVGV